MGLLCDYEALCGRSFEALTTSPPAVPGRGVELPPPAGSGAGHPGGHVRQLVRLHNLHGLLARAGQNIQHQTRA